MPANPVPDRDEFFARWSALHGGYDPRGKRAPRAWLSVTYAVGAPLARRGVPPDLLTALGGVVGVLVALAAAGGGRWPLTGAALVLLSGLLDGLDGAVAALSGRATRFGYVLDSLVDRLSDGLYLLAFWLLGGPGWLCVLGGAGTVLQEYLRARAGNAGMTDLGVVTVAERPTRVLVAAFTLLACGVASAYAGSIATAGAAVWVLTALIGFSQLLMAVHRRLAG